MSLVERIAAAFKASELDCSMWCDEALHELAVIAIAAVNEAEASLEAGAARIDAAIDRLEELRKFGLESDDGKSQ